ncbi:hypothetical protein GGX14DRAFT_393995 [Mycena pura]|uniref:Uncharacterized protein n=1 Tax=Mycena pura TaxID=153505 RepID=A0AAD6YCJ6_9AGAR|nr:hypothetical protein GGX14DRAFT_393995 [Mycena pura]
MLRVTAIGAIIATVTIDSDAGGAEGTRGTGGYINDDSRLVLCQQKLLRAWAIGTIVAIVTVDADAGGAEGTGGIDAAGTEGTGGRINYDSGCNQCVWEWFYASENYEARRGPGPLAPSKKLLRAWAIGAIVAIVLIDADAGGAEGIGGIPAAPKGARDIPASTGKSIGISRELFYCLEAQRRRRRRVISRPAGFPIRNRLPTLICQQNVRGLGAFGSSRECHTNANRTAQPYASQQSEERLAQRHLLLAGHLASHVSGGQYAEHTTARGKINDIVAKHPASASCSLEPLRRNARVCSFVNRPRTCTPCLFASARKSGHAASLGSHSQICIGTSERACVPERSRHPGTSLSLQASGRMLVRAHPCILVCLLAPIQPRMSRRTTLLLVILLLEWPRPCQWSCKHLFAEWTSGQAHARVVTLPLQYSVPLMNDDTTAAATVTAYDGRRCHVSADQRLVPVYAGSPVAEHLASGAASRRFELPRCDRTVTMIVAHEVQQGHGSCHAALRSAVCRLLGHRIHALSSSRAILALHLCTRVTSEESWSGERLHVSLHPFPCLRPLVLSQRHICRRAAACQGPPELRLASWPRAIVPTRRSSDDVHPWIAEQGAPREAATSWGAYHSPTIHPSVQSPSTTVLSLRSASAGHLGGCSPLLSAPLEVAATEGPTLIPPLATYCLAGAPSQHATRKIGSIAVAEHSTPASLSLETLRGNTKAGSVPPVYVCFAWYQLRRKVSTQPAMLWSSTQRPRLRRATAVQRELSSCNRCAGTETPSANAAVPRCLVAIICGLDILTPRRASCTVLLRSRTDVHVAATLERSKQLARDPMYKCGDTSAKVYGEAEWVAQYDRPGQCRDLQQRYNPASGWQKRITGGRLTNAECMIPPMRESAVNLPCHRCPLAKSESSAFTAQEQQGVLYNYGGASTEYLSWHGTEHGKAKIAISAQVHGAWIRMTQSCAVKRLNTWRTLSFGIERNRLFPLHTRAAPFAHTPSHAHKSKVPANGCLEAKRTFADRAAAYLDTTKQPVTSLRLHAGFARCQAARQRTGALWHWSHLGDRHMDRRAAERLSGLHPALWFGSRRYRPCPGTFNRRRGAQRLGASITHECEEGTEQSCYRAPRADQLVVALGSAMSRGRNMADLPAWVGPTVPSAMLDSRDTPAPARHLHTAALAPTLLVWGARHLARPDAPLPLASPRRYLAQHFVAFAQQAAAERGAPSGAAPRFIWTVPYIADRVAQVARHCTCQGLAYAAASGCVDVALAVARLGGILHRTVLRPPDIHLLFYAHSPGCRTARIWRGLHALYKKQYIPVHSFYIRSLHYWKWLRSSGFISILGGQCSNLNRLRTAQQQSRPVYIGGNQGPEDDHSYMQLIF